MIGDNTLGEYVYQDGPFLELPKEGTFQAVVLSAYTPFDIILRVHNDDISAKLDQLEKEIAEYAESVPHEHSPKVNEICIALFSDKKWHRAACKKIYYDSYPWGPGFDLINVDGLLETESDFIKSRFIRRIPTRFFEFLPYVAHRTVLENVTGENLSRELFDLFEGFLPEKSIVSVSVVDCINDVCIVRIPTVRDRYLLWLSQRGFLL